MVESEKYKDIKNTLLHYPNYWSNIIFLQPYSNNPEFAFNLASDVVEGLMNMFKIPLFSPILHTHHLDLNFKQKKINKDVEFYYNWDFKLYYAFRKPLFIFALGWEKSKGCKLEMDWVKIQGFDYLILGEDFLIG